jgi:hypothetical protein
MRANPALVLKAVGWRGLLLLTLGLALGLRFENAWRNLEAIFKDLAISLSRSVEFCIMLERWHGFILIGVLIAVVCIVVEYTKPRSGFGLLLAITVVGTLYQAMIVFLLLTQLDGLSKAM